MGSQKKIIKKKFVAKKQKNKTPKTEPKPMNMKELLDGVRNQINQPGALLRTIGTEWMTPREADVMNQMLKASEHVNERTFISIDETVADNIKKLYDRFARYKIDNGRFLLSSHFTAAGGVIELILIDGLIGPELCELNYGDRKDIKGYDIGILIEPSDFGHVEPYDRQHPYYLGHGYGRLDKINFDRFNLLYTKEAFRHNTWKHVSNFDYNKYWKMVSFDIILEATNVEEFLTEFLKLSCINDDIIRETIQVVLTVNERIKKDEE